MTISIIMVALGIKMLILFVKAKKSGHLEFCI